MKLLQNTSLIPNVNRYAVTVLVLVLLLTTSRVQAVDASEKVIPLPDRTAKTGAFQTTEERGIVVPFGKFIRTNKS